MRKLSIWLVSILAQAGDGLSLNPAAWAMGADRVARGPALRMQLKGYFAIKDVALVERSDQDVYAAARPLRARDR